MKNSELVEKYAYKVKLLEDKRSEYARILSSVSEEVMLLEKEILANPDLMCHLQGSGIRIRPFAHDQSIMTVDDNQMIFLNDYTPPVDSYMLDSQEEGLQNDE